MPVKPQQLASVKGQHRILLETGSSNGQGIDAALAAGYQFVHSVELSEKYHQLCVEKFRDSDRVFLSQGDSGDWLNYCVPKLLEPVVFYLDAHKSAPDSAQGRDVNPILRELQAIAKSPIKTHTILVDDFPSLGVPTEQVLAVVLAINPAYEISYMDVVQGDGSVTRDGMMVARVK